MLIDGTAILSMAVRRLTPFGWRLNHRSVFIIAPDAASTVAGAVYVSARQKLKAFRQVWFEIHLVNASDFRHKVSLPVGAFYILQNPLEKKDFNILQRNDLVDLEAISNDTRFLELPAVVEAIFRILDAFDYRRRRIAIVGAKGNVGSKIFYELTSGGIGPLAVDKGDDLASIEGYEIVISAVGQPGLLTRSLLCNSKLVVDVGFWLDPATGEAFGDVEKSCYDMDVTMTPVPGGVGPLQVLTLLERAVGHIDSTQVSPWGIKQMTITPSLLTAYD
jgi:methylenetetrahydrofolate dehydrogenase (NADP+)/methenyltetrahydrofolate cyclohydrolase